MIIDMHVHQRKHSSDSRLDVYKAVDIAKSRGLDALCITDHDDLGLRQSATEISAELGFPIIVGVEIFTLDGDLLCFGIDEMPKERLSAQETIDFVNERGGVTIAAHPYRNNNRGLGDTIARVQGLGGVEAFNGRTDTPSNIKARNLGNALNLPLTGGSDAHTDEEVGNFATRFLVEVRTESDFIHALRRGLVEPVSVTGREMTSIEIA